MTVLGCMSSLLVIIIIIIRTVQLKCNVTCPHEQLEGSMQVPLLQHTSAFESIYGEIQLYSTFLVDKQLAKNGVSSFA